MAHLPDDARRGMQSDLAQMDAIISQFLDYARPNDRHHVTTVDITALVADTAQEAARLPNMQVASHFEGVLEIEGNPVDLKRVLNNLVENARRYGRRSEEEAAELAFDCRAEGGHAAITITDRGPGIPDADIERLLRPFTRLDNARSQANGAGLGLAIVDRIVKRHRGSLKLENHAQGGLSIKILLPLAAAR
jgi:two-component system osmolarity sensor histidine kinase EnvZ